MKRFDFIYSAKFNKQLQKMSKTDQKMVRKKLEVLAVDPEYPSLRTKYYQRMAVQGVRESSVNMSIRILWRYEDGKIILLMQVGQHDIL